MRYSLKAHSVAVVRLERKLFPALEFTATREMDSLVQSE
jgi:hypothetical protein